MRQYIEQKAAAPDALLLFRMGDFYETFYDDAITAARVLGITLTTRGKDRNGQAVPLAGIPYHALEGYLTKLVRAGFKVAISEQLEDPKLAKGVVKRDIVRIVTPGTLTDDALLERKADNYLTCLHHRRDETGLACVELSTGAFWVQTVAEKELLSELVRLAPAELILAEVPIDARDPLAHVVKELTGPNPLIPSLLVTRRPAHVFDPYQADQHLRQHFGVATLEGFGFDRIDASLSAAAAIIDYLSETQKGSLNHIVKLTRREPRDFVLIDQSTWRALEIERTIRGGSASGSLLQSVDRTSTPMGARCLRRWLAAPLRDAKRIRERQQAIADLLADLHLLQAVRNEMGKLADIERITARLGVGRASPRDLLALGHTLLGVEKIAATLDRLAAATSITGEQLCPFLADRCDALRGEHDLAAFLTTSLHPNAPLVLNDGGIIADGYDAELDRLRTMGTNAQQWLADYQAREIRRSGINSLKVGYNQVFGYYIEITHAHAARIPPDYVRKQTLKNAERYVTDELKKYETEILTARDRAVAREQELFEIIRQRAIERIAPLQRLAAAISEIDVTAGLAHLADERRYVRPEMVEGNVLEISEGRHPVLEQALAEKFVPNDCYLGFRVQGSGFSEGTKGKQSSFFVARASGFGTGGSGSRSAGGETRRGEVQGSEKAETAPGNLFGTEADLKSEASDLKSQISNLKSDISNRQSDISDRQSEISNLKSEISNLKSPISNPRSETLAILTGPNMAGKSTYIRQIALLTLLAQTGSYVPAASMRFTPADRIFARIGASDELTRGQSTFMVEMTEAANILNNASEASLVIIDELGRGTSTFDGLALAWAIAEQLVVGVGCRTLFATHYHELTELEKYMNGVVNYNVAVREWQDEVVFLHRIVRGKTDRSYGVHVAKLAGVGPEVVARSREILAELEANFSATRRAPRRTARRNRRDDQLLLFADPADEVIKEIRQLDPHKLTPIDALQAIEKWRKRLEE